MACVLKVVARPDVLWTDGSENSGSDAGVGAVLLVILM
jgi:hypothetical protein